jgi:DNA-directed RNA polymerase specialized sigma24 family protein
MSWLYDHRDQLDGLRPLVEIAYHATYGIPPCDRDDVEQDILIALLRVSQRRNELAYLRGVARKEVKRYWCRKCYQITKFRYFYEDEDFASQDGDIEARLDAIAMLITLPKRLVEIGYDRLNGKKLSVAEQRYWIRHKTKLDCRKNGREVSDWEKRRIARLHDEGMSVYKIAKAMGRSTTTIRLYLFNAGLRQIKKGSIL